MPTHSAALGILLLDRSGAVAEVDGAAATALGYATAEACLAALRRAPPRAGAGLAVALRVPEGQAMHLLADCPGAAGRSVPCDLYVRAERDRLVVLLEPLTVRRARRRRTERRFQALVEAGPQILWSAGPGGELDYINGRGAEYAGVPVERGLADRWLEFVHPADRDHVRGRWQRSVKDGVAYSNEFRLRRADGAFRWHLARALPLRDGRGRIVEWYGSATDIEDEKRAQQALQEEERRKDDFLAVLGHELRTPLTPMRTAAHLLRRVAPGALAFERAVAMVERQVALMARLVDDLLEVSRIVRGTLEIHRERIDLAALVQTLIDERREALAASGLSLAPEVPPGPVWVEADAARLAQAIGNLLENAERYTPTGGKAVVALRTLGSSAELSVRDNGIGFDLASQVHLFEPFVQLPGASRMGSAGLGLGLSLVKRLIELHGGSVSGHSEGPGLGATFTIRLPLAGAPRTAPPPLAPAAATVVRRILVVEDNPDTAEALRIMLELDGHEVAVAGTGEEGLARARELHPDVVLSDIGLPGMNGYELARTLRADAEFHSHLVAVTGYGQARDKEEAFRSGFERHLTKPFDHDALDRVLGELRP